MARDRKPNLPEGDDGRTIVNMNVEGMPWYVKERETPPGAEEGSQMTKEEARRYTWGAIRAGLLIALVFGVIFALFIAFCDFVWFK